MPAKIQCPVVMFSIPANLLSLKQKQCRNEKAIRPRREIPRYIRDSQ